jgi:hypothetical protein
LIKSRIIAYLKNSKLMLFNTYIIEFSKNP